MSSGPDDSGEFAVAGALGADASETRDAPAPRPAGAIRAGKLAGKSLGAAIWIVSVPVLVQQTMAALIGLVDTVLAGRLPPGQIVASLDAIGIGSYLVWFISIAMVGLGIGGQVLIARGMGAGDLETCRRTLGNALVLSVVWGCLIGVLMWSLAGPLGVMCKLSPDALADLIVYVRIIAYCMPAAAVMMVGSMCMYGAGETTWPSAIAIAVNIANVFVSWALSGVDLSFGGWTLVNPFAFDMHLAGIAAGTAISYGLGAVLTAAILARGVKDLRLDARDMAIDGLLTRRIIRIGVPGFLDSMMMWSANLFVLYVIGLIAGRAATGGAPAEGLQGAHMIAIRWEAFSFLPGFAMGTAAGALAGQYLGAGNERMARHAIVVCTVVAASIMGVLGVVFAVAGEPLTRFISDEPVHLRETPKLLLICGVVQVFFALTMVMRQGLRGVGDTTWTFAITTVSSFAVRLPAAWLLGYVLGWGLVGVWIGLCGEIVFRGLVFTARFVHGGWMRVRV